MNQKLNIDQFLEIEGNTIPQCVSVTKNPKDQTREQLIQRQEKFLKLPENIQDKLVSRKTSEIIQRIGTDYRLELLQLADISRAIRSYYFGELKLEDFPFVLSKEMGIDLTRAEQIFQVINDRIINDQSYERAAQAALVSIPLSEALRIYPEVGEQLVTSSKISLRNFPYPVRPSIKNWIADYTFNLGYEKHESMARSNYLFQGPNTKNLPAPEKNKLAYLLKSFDENSPLTVNKNTKQIIFPARNASNSDAGGPAINPADKPSTTPVNAARAALMNRHSGEINPPKALTDQYRPVSTPPTEQKNINSMQFSYRQTLPYEKKTASPAPIKNLPPEIPDRNRGTEHISQIEPPKVVAEKPKTQRLSPVNSDPWRLPGKPSSPQNIPRNVVDLKNINQ